MPSAFRYEVLSQATSPEEGRFYLHVANFFLQEKQKELIEQGVYQWTISPYIPYSLASMEQVNPLYIDLSSGTLAKRINKTALKGQR